MSPKVRKVLWTLEGMFYWAVAIALVLAVVAGIFWSVNFIFGN